MSVNFERKDNKNPRHDQIRLREARYHESDHLDRLTHPTNRQGLSRVPYCQLTPSRPTKIQGKYNHYRTKEHETDRQKATGVPSKFLITHPVE